jgi:hypothetical protein
MCRRCPPVREASIFREIPLGLSLSYVRSGTASREGEGDGFLAGVVA